MEETVLKKAEKYWTRRAAGYSKVNQEELNGSQRVKWFQKLDGRIRQQYPERTRADIRILDVGTGPGFFAVILAEAGYDVTAVDYTPAMLDQAKANAGALADRIRFLRMDGQDLEFPDNTFDVVISRNLTWGLEHPKRAYASWKRVLKPGGLLLNFDANWYHHLYDSQKREAYERDRDAVRKQGMEDYNTAPDIDEAAMEEIVRAVPLGKIRRPQWDRKILKELDMGEIKADTEVWKDVWSPAEQVNFASTPLFMVAAVKE